MKTGTPIYTLKAIAGNPGEVFKECADDVKATVGPVLDKYHPMDLPLICALLKILALCLEQHPAFGEAGLELEQTMMEQIEIINLSALGDKGRCSS